MTNLADVIKRSHDEDGLSAEDIAAGMGLDAALVRGVLAGASAEYRLEQAAVGNLDPYEIVTDGDFKRIRDAYKDLALNDPNTPPHVRERMLRWMLDEKKGRNRVKEIAPGININILNLNKRLQEIQAKSAKALEVLAKPQ